MTRGIRRSLASLSRTSSIRINYTPPGQGGGGTPGDVVAPVITSEAFASVAENSSFALTLTSNEAVTWSKVGGADQTLFTLANSVLSLTAKDFETPSDANGDNIYSVTVRATDAAGNYTDQDIAVSVTNVTEDTIPPIITSANTISLDENLPLTHVLTANEAVTWAKVGGADQSLFTLVGNVLTLTAKDYENPVDSGANNSYVVQVRATDSSGLTTTQTITVLIENAFEDTTAPTITSSATPTVSENAAFTHTLTANETVGWIKVGGADQALFALEDNILTMFAKDFETPLDADANNTYVVVVRALDVAGNYTDQTITVTVTNASEATGSAPTLRGYTVVSGSTASLVANKPTGTAEGDKLLFVTTQDITTTASTFTPPTNDGTLITAKNSSFGGAGVQMEAWQKTAGASEPATYTMTRSQARIGTFWVFAIADPGAGTAWKHLISEVINNSGAASEPTWGALDPTLEPLLEISMVTWDEGKTLVAPPTGYTNDWQDLSGHDALLSYRTRANGAAVAALPVDLNAGTKWAGFRLLTVSTSAVADTSVTEPETPPANGSYPTDPLTGNGTETISSNIHLEKWKVTLPVNADGLESGVGDAIEVTALAGYQRPPYYDILTDGTLKFLVPAGGARTSGSNYPRCELREMNGSGSLYNWNPATGTHVLQATCKLTHLPDPTGGGKGRIIIGQIHGPNDELNRLYYDNGDIYFQDDMNSVGAANYRFQLKDGSNNSPNIPLNAFFSYEIRVQDGVHTVTVVYNGVTYTASESLSAFWLSVGAGCYFKAGNYMQVSVAAGAGTKGTGYGIAVFSAISTPSHT